MSKFLIIFSLSLFIFAAHPTTEAEAGQFDGVWYTAAIPGSYFMVRQTDDNKLILTRLADNGSWWEAFYGDMSGNSATITTVISTVSAGVTVQFLSTTSATAVVNYCNPSYNCDLPAGATVNISRIF
ncbi:MAG: hypothetical protein OEV89_00350 [Desulfobulbaceae bacterium]|nr:hypothetical protein [Desulfobulbaceae bacterium]HIJ89292.1 hypothetical protein [Deltaproteobacteria bacterium]